jgi:signal transduction histidine kinase
MTLTISVATEENATRTPDALAYALGLAVAALLLARRQQPLLVLVGSIGILMIYFGLDYPAFSPAVPLAPAAYSAAAAGRTLPAAAILAGLLVFGAAWQTIGEDDDVLSVLGTGALADAALLAAVLLLGEAVRNRRRWAEEVAARRVQEERLRIARELHDVMAHTIAGINVQAAVAADVIEDEPEQARRPLQAIRTQTREAMAELKATVGLLRSDAADAPRAPAPGLALVEELARQAEDASVAVGLSVSGGARPLPAAIDLTAYRIVQESLTNVVRHSGAATATVLVRYELDAVVVEVSDDGRSGNGFVPGFGIAGMRERAAAVGGTLEAGRTPGSGFRVHARLPTEDAPA